GQGCATRVQRARAVAGPPAGSPRHRRLPPAGGAAPRAGSAAPAPEVAIMIDGPVALLGGTGKQGTGLARRFLEGGVDVVIGSRDPAKAEKVAAELGCEGAGNAEAAQRAQVVVATIPYAGMAATVVP